MKESNKGKSLLMTMIGEFLMLFIVSSVIMIVVLVNGFFEVVSGTYDFFATPFADHLESLQKGDFKDIDITNLLGKDSFFIIYAEGDEIYSSAKEEIKLNQSQIRLIPFEQYAEITGNQLKNADVLIEYKNIDDEVLESIIMKDNVIIYSSLEMPISQVDEKSLELLLGFYNDYRVRKGEFIFDSQLLTAVFFIKNHSGAVIDDEILIGMLILFAIMVGIATVTLYIYLVRINNKVTKPLNELQGIVDEFQIGNDIQINYQGPKEFVSLFNSFEIMSDKLAQLEKEKLIANEERQRILADISHDLKTPISVVKSYAEAINSDLLNNIDQSTYLRVISNNVDKLSELIDEFNDYNKLESPDFQLSRDTVNPYEYSREYFIKGYDELSILGYELELDIPDKHAEALIDEFQIKRVFDNIISNTIKYNSKGTTIYFSIYEKDDALMIHLGDDGIGIPNHIRKDIFLPFVIGDKARSQGKGSGLGLSIVKKIIDLHQGYIELMLQEESKLATEYKISIPKCEDRHENDKSIYSTINTKGKK